MNVNFLNIVHPGLKLDKCDRMLASERSYIENSFSIKVDYDNTQDKTDSTIYSRYTMLPISLNQFVWYCIQWPEPRCFYLTLNILYFYHNSEYTLSLILTIR